MISKVEDCYEIIGLAADKANIEASSKLNGATFKAIDTNESFCYAYTASGGQWYDYAGEEV